MNSAFTERGGVKTRQQDCLSLFSLRWQTASYNVTGILTQGVLEFKMATDIKKVFVEFEYSEEFLQEPN